MPVASRDTHEQTLTPLLDCTADYALALLRDYLISCKEYLKLYTLRKLQIERHIIDLFVCQVARLRSVFVGKRRVHFVVRSVFRT